VYNSLPAQNNTAYLLGCLLVSGLSVSPSTPVVVPAH